MKRVLGVGVVLAALTAALWVIPSGHYLFLPDRARPVDPLVAVPGEADDANGGIYMVDILVRKASLFERVFPGFEEGADLVPEEAVNPVGLTEQVRRKTSLNQMSRSQRVAVAVALRELGHRIERSPGAEVTLIYPDTPAAEKLELGDVIVGVVTDGDEERVTSPVDLTRRMSRVRPGDEVRLRVRADGREEVVAVATQADPRDEDRAIIGIRIECPADFELPVDVKIDAGDIGGPSAGLAFALNVVDELRGDIDGGRRVAVTGELDCDGNVIAIGGVKQKTIGARNADADVFVVPRENAEEARRHAEGLEIVAVSSFDQALARLATN